MLVLSDRSMPRLSPAAPSQGVEQQQTVARLRIADVQDAQGNANTWCRGTPARYPIHDTAHKLTKPDESPKSGSKRYLPWLVGLDPAMSDLPASIWNMLPPERRGRIGTLLGQMALHRMRS